MKVLIFASPRSGSTALTIALSKCLNLKAILEPFNPLNVKNLSNQELDELKSNIPNNRIVKVISNHRSEDYFKDFIKQFDTVVYLTRSNQQAAVESFNHAQNLNDNEKWHQPYMINPKSFEIDKSIEPIITESTYIVKKVASSNKKPYLIYEDLYSKDINRFYLSCKNIDLDINKDTLRAYLDPKNKYRLPYKTKILI